MMENQTGISSVLLMSLSDNQETIYLLFIIFLLIYLMTVFSNFLIILLVVTCPHLHTPMYFFLGNLAFLDMSSSSVIGPSLLLHLSTRHWSISFWECTAQTFFAMYFGGCEIYLLTSMSYDRYVAICRPLLYSQLMASSTCTKIVCFVWSVALIVPIICTVFIRRLSFCGPNLIQSFFCDLPHLFQISCTDTTLNLLVTSILGAVIGSTAFAATFYPYVRIFRAVLRIRSSDGKSKAFSTCTSHLTVVIIFYASVTFIYLVPDTSNFLALNQLVTVMYTLVTPLLNPIIYSLRSRDLQGALQRLLHRHRLHPDSGT